MSEQQNYWDQAQAGAQEESGPGKPVIGLGRVDLGYFAFAPGHSGDDRKKCIFLPQPGQAGREKALRAAQQLCKDSGKSADFARWCIITTIYRDEAVYTDGSDVTWNGDQLDPIPLWTVWDKQGNRKEEPSAGGLVLDTVNRLKIQGGQDFYGQFGWQADPHKLAEGEAGKTKEYNGEMRYPTVCVVQKVYASREAAQAAVVSGEDSGQSAESYPWADFPGASWTNADWAKEANDIEMALAELGDTDLDEFCEDEFAENSTWAIRALKTGGKGVGKIVKLTGLEKAEVLAALA